MKKIIIFIIILLIIGSATFFFIQRNENVYKSEYKAEKSSVKKEDDKNNETSKKEIEISSFSTNIKNKDKERQNNITITCNSLNGKEIKAGEIFSFCDIVGKATSEKGYQKADIYVDGKKEQGYGGGNCQVSTTLYNAVLEIPELEIIERHEHSGHVPYIEDGKDAAVSYGSYDFKFKNNTLNTIKIYIENTEEEIIAKLIKIEPIM